MLKFAAAQDLVRGAAKSFGTERVELGQVLGRVLAEDVAADRDYPPFNRATMDGIAIRYEDFLAGERDFTIVETVHAGAVGASTLATAQAFKIMTGAPVPSSADVVIRREDTTEANGRVRVHLAEVRQFQSISRQGEDVRAGRVLLAAGSRCLPAEVGALAALGRSSALVHQRPRVALVSTGDEVVPVGAPTLSHQIRDSNAHLLSAMLEQHGVPVDLCFLVRDEPAELRQVLNAALASDVLIVSGGVSAGDADYVPAIMAELGIQKVFHKVAIRPGKPLWFGRLPNGGAAFGLPGNPLSCQVVFKLFVEPYLRAAWQRRLELTAGLPLAVARAKRSPLDEFFPCALTDGGIRPMTANSSGDVTAAMGSSGLALHPADEGDLAAGQMVSYWPW